MHKTQAAKNSEKINSSILVYKSNNPQGLRVKNIQLFQTIRIIKKYSVVRYRQRLTVKKEAGLEIGTFTDF